MCWDLGQLFLIRLLKKNSATAENVAQTIETKVNRNLEISKLEGWKGCYKGIDCKKVYWNLVPNKFSFWNPLPSYFALPPRLETRCVGNPHYSTWSNSLPNLNMISWYKPEYDHTDDAEEALGEQYDKSGNNST